MRIRNSEFESFARKKEREANAAIVPSYVTDVERREPDLEIVGNDWSRRLFDGDFFVSPPPSGRPACNLVFVQSLDGNTVAPDPSQLGGGETDKHVIYEGLSRVDADAVLAGAGTIRGGRIVMSVWHPELVTLRARLGKPRHPVQVVATLQGLDLEHGLLFNTPSIAVAIITVGPTAALMQTALSARPWIKVIAMTHSSDLVSAFEQLRSMGIERISCIGGRQLATQLIDAGLVQDLYLTTSARRGGEPNTPMYPEPVTGRTVVRKQGTGPEAGVTFEHLVIERAGGAGRAG